MAPSLKTYFYTLASSLGMGIRGSEAMNLSVGTVHSCKNWYERSEAADDTAVVAEDDAVVLAAAVAIDRRPNLAVPNIIFSILAQNISDLKSGNQRAKFVV